jgi:mycofactocin system glycosyltransferase
MGFTVRLAGDVSVYEGGSVLVGGSPLSAVRLAPGARERLAGGTLVVSDAASAVVGDRLLAGNLAMPVLSTLAIAAAEDLTVVIPARDRADQLEQTLASIRGVAVLVVDDASVDAPAVAEVVSRHGADLVRVDANVGPAGARNIGLARVETPYVAFVDSDVVVTADALIGLTAHFADPSVALVAPHVRSRTLSDRPRWFERYDAAMPALGLGERPGVVRPGAAVAWLPSACLVARTDTVRTGFDDRMRVGEDVDLVWRLTDSGHRVRYDPGFVAHHAARQTLRAWMARKFVYGTGGAGLGERHPANMLAAHMSPTMAIAATALMLRRPWSIPLALASLTVGARSLGRRLPEFDGRGQVAVRTSARGLWWSLRQESALALRHWWPASVAAALASRSARRIVVSAMLVDLVATVVERPELNPVRTFAGRRLDDLCYGAGLWCGAIRHGSLRSLRVKLDRPRRRSPGGVGRQVLRGKVRAQDLDQRSASRNGL